MTELKTLKDFTTKGLKFREKRASEKLIEDLKAEAVKWIKELEVDEFNHIPYELGFCDSGYDEYAQKRHGNVINWIKHFFNLSEGDLQ